MNTMNEKHMKFLCKIGEELMNFGDAEEILEMNEMIWFNFLIKQFKHDKEKTKQGLERLLKNLDYILGF